MNKTIQRPLACRNAHCGAMCSPADAEFFGSNPSKCFNYERRDDLYRKTEILDKVKRARQDIAELDGKYEQINYGTYYENKMDSDKYVRISEVLAILDKLIESEDKE